MGKVLIQGHYEKWHQAQCCVPSSDHALVLCDVLSYCTALEPKALPEVAPSMCCLKYMSSLDNIDARIGRKPSITQKFHATSKTYGA